MFVVHEADVQELFKDSPDDCRRTAGELREDSGRFERSLANERVVWLFTLRILFIRSADVRKLTPFEAKDSGRIVGHIFSIILRICCPRKMTEDHIREWLLSDATNIIR